MTNNTQLVSFKKLCYGAQFKYSADDAAVWVKIGHNTVAGWNPKYVSDSWIGQPICAFAEDDQLDTDVWLVKPAPAEDVRAVVEEPAPFGYWCHPKDNPSLGFFHKTIEANTSSFCDVMPLYRHPQRPVVLPERWTARNFPLYMSPQDIAIRVEIQNACLDAVEELNK